MTVPPPRLPAQQIPYLTPPLPFRSRKGALIGFGILLIVIGAFSALATATIPLTLFIARMAPPGTMLEQDWRSLAVATLTYAAVATVFIWTGIGSIRCRRWVRPVMRIIAWAWLITGIMSIGMLAFLLPQMLAATPAPPSMPPLAMQVLVIVTLLFTFMIYVALPGLLAWFYQRRDVQETLDHFDPGPAWTDRCPTAVLGVSLGMWMAAAMMPISLLYNVVPFFGIILTGPAAAAVLILSAAIMAYGGWTSFQLRRVGWWIATLTLVAFTLSALLTFVRVPLIEMYRAMKMPQHQLDALAQFGDSYHVAALVSIAAFGIACLGYMLYVHRHFTSGADTAAPVMVQDPTNSS